MFDTQVVVTGDLEEENQNWLREIKEALETAEKEAVRRGEAEGMEQGMAKGIAEGMEQGMAKGMAEGMEKGMENGIEAGEERMAKLFSLLFETGRSEDLKRALSDLPYRKMLFEEFEL